VKRSATAIASIAILLGLSVLWAFQSPVRRSKLGQLKEGMSQDDVRAVLGEPTKVYPGQWTYKRPLVFGFVNIHWKLDGTFDGEVNFERF